MFVGQRNWADAYVIVGASLSKQHACMSVATTTELYSFMVHW